MKTHSPFTLNQHVAQMEHKPFEYSIRQKRPILMKLYSRMHEVCSELPMKSLFDLMFRLFCGFYSCEITSVIKTHLSFLLYVSM